MSSADLVGSIWTSPPGGVGGDPSHHETLVVLEQQRVVHTNKTTGEGRMGYNLECLLTFQDGRVKRESIGVYDEHVLGWLDRVR